MCRDAFSLPADIRALPATNYVMNGGDDTRRNKAGPPAKAPRALGSRGQFSTELRGVPD
jgi:hypothetical protein